jgi:hypothetical protein
MNNRSGFQPHLHGNIAGIDQQMAGERPIPPFFRPPQHGASATIFQYPSWAGVGEHSR